jgi:AcrR family transcriptional regulator
MPVIDAQTEKLIKETAMRIFFVEGRLHATTQVIAKEAGVNRGLIYYYFQSRDHLFESVFKEAAMMTRGRLRELLLAEGGSLREKIREFVEITIDHRIKYPYMEMFLITEMNRDGSKLLIPQDEATRKEMLHHLEEGLKEEIASGAVPNMSPEQFLFNVLSLCTYPSLYKPILKQMTGMDEHEFLKMLEERKSIVMKVLFKDL